MIFGDYGAVLFDWGDTVMWDDPIQSLPMVAWPQVEPVAGVDVLLRYLRAGFRIALATGAAVSNENEIRAALARVSLDCYFEKVYCFETTRLQKPSAAYYQYILDDLKLKPQDTLMIGDSFQKDVLAANLLGIPAVWYNPFTSEIREGENYFTVHTMTELLEWFQQADREPSRGRSKYRPSSRPG